MSTFEETTTATAITDIEWNQNPPSVWARIRRLETLLMELNAEFNALIATVLELIPEPKDDDARG